MKSNNAMRWTATGAVAASLSTLMVAAFIPWNTFVIHDIDSNTEFESISFYPWGAKLDVPGEACRVTRIYLITIMETPEGCYETPDGSGDEDVEAAVDRQLEGRNLLEISSPFWISGVVTLIIALFMEWWILPDQKRTSWLLTGTLALFLTAILLQSIGTTIFYDGFEEQISATVPEWNGFLTNDARAGTILGIVALVVMTFGVMLRWMAIRGPRSEARSEQRPSSSGLRVLACPRCKEPVQVSSGEKPVCWSCGLGA